MNSFQQALAFNNPFFRQNMNNNNDAMQMMPPMMNINMINSIMNGDGGLGFM